MQDENFFTKVHVKSHLGRFKLKATISIISFETVSQSKEKLELVIDT